MFTLCELNEEIQNQPLPQSLMPIHEYRRDKGALLGLIQKDTDRVRVAGAGDDEIRHLIAGRMK